MREYAETIISLCRIYFMLPDNLQTNFLPSNKSINSILLCCEVWSQASGYWLCTSRRNLRTMARWRLSEAGSIWEMLLEDRRFFVFVARFMREFFVFVAHLMRPFLRVTAPKRCRHWQIFHAVTRAKNLLKEKEKKGKEKKKEEEKREKRKESFPICITSLIEGGRYRWQYAAPFTIVGNQRRSKASVPQIKHWSSTLVIPLNRAL